jgi:putative flippase GtrA
MLPRSAIRELSAFAGSVERVSTHATSTGRLATLVARVRRGGPEIVKFVVVGGLCFLLDFGLANLFYKGLSLGPTTSKALSTIIATACSYVGNRLWSFAHRVDSDNPTHARDITLFGLINAVGLLITLVPVVVVHYGFGLKSDLAFNISQVAGTGIATVFRFWAYRRWVFASPDAVAATAGDATAGVALVIEPRSGDDDAALNRTA